MGKKAKKRRTEREEKEVKSFLSQSRLGDIFNGGGSTAGPNNTGSEKTVMGDGDGLLTDHAVAQMYLSNGVYDFRLAPRHPLFHNERRKNDLVSFSDTDAASSSLHHSDIPTTSRRGGGSGSRSTHRTIVTISPGVQMFSADSVEFKGLRSAYNLASQRQPTPDEESNDTTAHGSLLTSPKHFLGTERPPGLKPEAANRIFASSSSSFPSSPPRTSRSPSPIIEFFAGVPSEGYLQSSLQPSLLCPVSTTNPKLLILDLNGTLVYRSPRNRRQNRVITPRPYMEPFTRYVTHEGSGLQTMIWSSAQPVNVEKMARACFGEEGVKNLKAIWARDTLGLSQRDYGRKVQTVKDLNLVWKKLPFTALDTILLDDSRLKAHLQPYNHLILTEYDSDMSSRDRKILQRLYAASSSAVAGNVRQEEGELEESNARTLGDSEEPDQTLLAVIGILARGVRQTNVPGWMRAGGLWGSHSASISQSTSNLLFVKSADPSPSDIPLDDMNSDELNGQAVKRKRELSSDNEEGAIADQTIFQGIEDEPVKGPPRQSVQRLWFEDPEVFARWVAQGKAELERLNIPVLHGLRSSGAELENAQAGGIHQATLRV